MAFAPLPRPLRDDLAARPGAPVLDLGCGDGRCGRALARHGAVPWGLDRVPPSRGSAARVVGDVLRPPLAPGRWPLVVAANVVRHLGRAGLEPGLIARWCDLLTPDGALWVLEDQPGRATPAQRHQTALQELLAGLPGRGGWLARERFERTLGRVAGARWRAGAAENRYPLDPAAALALLDAGAPGPGTAAARLREAIARDGVACGPYWWVRVTRGEEQRCEPASG